MAYAEYEKDADNIVLVSFDDPDSPVNVMNTNFLEGLDELLGKLEEEENLAGVIITSAKDTFFAGGDLENLARLEGFVGHQGFGDAPEGVVNARHGRQLALESDGDGDDECRSPVNVVHSLPSVLPSFRPGRTAGVSKSPLRVFSHVVGA